MDATTSTRLTESLLVASQITTMPSFFDKGACIGADSRIFDDYSKHHDLAAKVCSSCPIRQQCLNWAIENEQYGFWAGTTPAMRSRMRSKKVVDITVKVKQTEKELILASTMSNAEVALRLGCTKRTVIRQRNKLRAMLAAS